MDIAIIGTRYSPPFFRGGEERIIHELKKNFKKKGHTINVYTPKFNKWKDIDLKSEAQDTKRIPIHDIRFFYNFEFSYKFNKMLLKDKIEHDIYLNTHPHLGYFQKKKPHILLVNTTSYGEAKSIRNSSLKKIIEKLTRLTLAFWADKKIYKDSDFIVCVSNHIKNEIIKRYSIPQGKIIVIRNGVDCDFFLPKDNDDKETKDKEVIISYVGRLANRKNLDLLLYAAYLLNKERFQFKVRIAGEGEEEKRLKELANSLKIERIVDFLGRRESDEILNLYQTSDIFVLPSRYEGVPLVLLEAQACGLPAVVTSFDGADEIIKDGENGFVVSNWQPQEFAKYLKILINDSKRRITMAKKARAMMVEEYSWDKIADKFLGLFKNFN